MEPNRNALLVGIMVLFLLVGAIGAALWLSQAGREEQPERYVVFFVKQSLSGLDAGASVTMLGIKVGQVEQVSIDPTDFTRVRVDLALRPGTPVTVSTTALIQRNLLTGLANVDLVGSMPQSPRVIGSRVQSEELPEIQEGVPQIVQLQRTLPVILDHLDKLLSCAGDVLNEENREKVARIIANFDQLSGTLTETSTSIREGAGEVSGVVQDFLRQFDKRTAHVSESFERTSVDVSRQMASVSNALGEALRALTRLINQLEHPRRLILGPARKDLGPGEAGTP